MKSARPNILIAAADGWAEQAVKQVVQAINSAIVERGICHVMLTGGGTAERFYIQWANSPLWPMKHLRFLFGDERCVPPDHPDSNYALAMRILMAKGMPSECSISRIEAECPDQDAAARRYEQILPERIDVLLLGMGVDGHIASIFPGNVGMQSTCRSVVPVRGPKPPHERITITPRVVANARSVFLLATGRQKGEVLANAFGSPGDNVSLPVRLILGGTWLLDAEAGRQVQKFT